MVKEKGILEKSIRIFLGIAGAIFIPLRSLSYLNGFGFTDKQILIGWSSLYIGVLLILATYAYHKQKKNYFEHTIKIFTFIFGIVIYPIIFSLSFVLNTIKGLFYLQYLGEIIEQNKKIKTDKVVEAMKKSLKKDFKELFNVPSISQTKNIKGKKGQTLFIALLIALLVLLVIIGVLFFKGG